MKVELNCLKYQLAQKGWNKCIQKPRIVNMSTEF